MPFSLGIQPLKTRSIGQHVGGFKHHLNGYFVVFWDLFPGVTSQDFPRLPRLSVQYVPLPAGLRPGGPAAGHSERVVLGPYWQEDPTTQEVGTRLSNS